MVPSAVSTDFEDLALQGGLCSRKAVGVETNYSMDRDLRAPPIELRKARGNVLYTKDGREILDGSGGASVSSIGHSHPAVLMAMSIQMSAVTYCNSAMFSVEAVSDVTRELAEVAGFAKVYLCSSGSEAMEAAMKLGRQYFVEMGQNERVNFIARDDSYHGATLGALSMSGHKARREKYLPLLINNIHRVSSCYPYRQRICSESDADFVAKKSTELEQLLLRLGPETVIGFVCEPIVGATLGCVPYVHGYLAAMKAVCTKYGVLFILDEVMCGMGRSGTMHAWQAEHSNQPGCDCRPDIQTVGKGLAGGYQPMAGLLVGEKIINILKDGSGAFAHGHTYQSHSVAAAAALAVQKVIREERLLENCRNQGAYMMDLLHRALDSHPNVGDIRGMGLFCGIEFVKDKVTKEPFDPLLNIAGRVQDMALSGKYNLAIYKGSGTADGVRGDHAILSPALNSTSNFIEVVVEKFVGAVNDVFEELATQTSSTRLFTSLNMLRITTNGSSSATTTNSSAINTPSSVEPQERQ